VEQPVDQGRAAQGGDGRVTKGVAAWSVAHASRPAATAFENGHETPRRAFRT
jgi:hypothetical protein